MQNYLNYLQAQSKAKCVERPTLTNVQVRSRVSTRSKNLSKPTMSIQSENLPKRKVSIQSENLPKRKMLIQTENLPKRKMLIQTENLPKQKMLIQTENLPKRRMLIQSENQAQPIMSPLFTIPTTESKMPALAKAPNQPKISTACKLRLPIQPAIYTLSNMPDLVLFNIFYRLPMLDLLSTINLVCYRWYALQRSACLQRKSLFILETQLELTFIKKWKYFGDVFDAVTKENGKPMIRLGSQLCKTLVRVKLTHEFVNRLVETFPNIEHFQFFYCYLRAHQLKNFNYLLGKWGQKLQTFKFLLKNDPHEKLSTCTELESSMAQYNKLVSSINTMRELKCLTFKLVMPEYLKHKLTIDLSIISQLREFTYFSENLLYNNTSQFNPWLIGLERYAVQNPELKEVCIRNMASLNSILRFKVKFCSKFVELHLDDAINTNNMNDYRLFCDRFTSLRILHLRISVRTPLFDVAQNLAQLVNLIHLELSICFSRGRDFPELNFEIPEYPKLESIKSLSLRSFTNSHNDTEKLIKFCSKICPNVQAINWQQVLQRCDSCNYDFAYFPAHRDQDEKTVENCWKRAVSPLKKFKMLRKVYVKIETLRSKKQMKHEVLPEQLSRW